MVDKKKLGTKDAEKEILGTENIKVGESRGNMVGYFKKVIKTKFGKILSGDTTISKREQAGIRKVKSQLPEFLINNLIVSTDDILNLSDKISSETALKIINILREGIESESNPKLLKYLGDDGVLRDEKKSFYMNKFSESFVSPDDFYAAIPYDIKESFIEKLYRFIEKQEIYTYTATVPSLDNYFRFLGEKIGFPKVGIRLLMNYYQNNGYITTDFNENIHSYSISLTEKGKNTYLGLQELLEIKGASEYMDLEGNLKTRVSEMIIKNLQEGRPDIDSIKDALFEEGIMVRKKDLKELLREIFQLMASGSSAKTVIQRLNEEIEEEKKYEVFGGVYQFKRKETRQSDGESEIKTYSIPVSEVDEIFKAYSKYGQNLTQKQVEYKFKISKAVWSLLKSRLDLTKDSLPVSPHTLENFEGNLDGLKEFSENLGDELIRDEFRKSILDAYDKQKAKEFERLKKIMANIDNFLEHLEGYLKGYKPRNLGFDELLILPKSVFKDEHLSISFGDVHLGKMNNEDIINRLKKITQMAISYPHEHICLIGLGDWFETVVEGGMHPGQVEGMDGPYGFDLIMLFVGLIEDMLITLSKAGKTVTFYSVGGNHDRLAKSHDGDSKRTANLIVLELIKKGMQNFDVKIEAFRDRTNTFSFGNFHYIVNHGEDGFSKKVKSRPEEILWEYGDQAKHNIIKFGHEHHGYLGETKNATIIGTSHLAGAGEYDTRLGLFSETGVTLIEQNIDGLPDVSFKRVR